MPNAPARDESHFGAWLKERRQALDLTQAQLAAQSGYSVETIRKLESGHRRPSREIAELLAGNLAIAEGERELFIRFARGLADTPPDPLAPALKPTAPRPPGFLPVPPTVLVGRDREVAELSELLLAAKPRLVTITGAPGMGKTSLALAGAAMVRPRFQDGVFFISLAALRDPELVAPAIARALGIAALGSADRPLVEQLHDHLWSRHLLLVLDNFEQILAAAPLVAELLQLAPKLRVLVTSRGVLRLRGEKEFALSPLAVPASDRLSAGELAAYPAVRLFVERAQEVRRGFAVTDENAPTLAAIARRLDGLPLAIELAAPHLRLLPPASVLDRLTRSLDLLADGPVDLPARQRTLRGAISWGYDLLAPHEQLAFRRLGVFIGGCTPEAAETLLLDRVEEHTPPPPGSNTTPTSDKPLAESARTRHSSLVTRHPSPVTRHPSPSTQHSALSTLESLARLSMLRLDQLDGPARFSMLETIREYALERLEESGEAGRVRARHAAYFCDLVEQARDELNGPNQQLWLERLEADHDNIRAALRWTIEGAHVEEALRLSGAVSRYWQLHGHLLEGRGWLEQALGVADKSVPAVGGNSPEASDLPDYRRLRARVLSGLGILVWMLGDHSPAREYLEQNLVLARQLGDDKAIASALNNLAVVVSDQGDYRRARQLCEELLRSQREQGDRRLLSNSLINLGNVAHHQGLYEEARALHEEAVSVARQLGNKRNTGIALHNLGNALMQLGDYPAALALHEENLAIRRELGDRAGIAYALNNIGNIVYRLGDKALGHSLLREALGMRRELGTISGIAGTLYDIAALLLEEEDFAGAAPLLRECLTLNHRGAARDRVAHTLGALAGVAAAAGDPERAALLFGAAEALRAALGIPIPAVQRPRYERDLAYARTSLPDSRWAALHAEGRLMSLDQALALALRTT